MRKKQQLRSEEIEMDDRDTESVDLVNIEGRLSANRINLITRTIIVYGFIDEQLSKEISDHIVGLDEVRDKPIYVKINSIGGNVLDTQCIITEFERAINDIHVDIVGAAYSGAGLLALAGDYVKMSKYGSLMLHYPNWETEFMSLQQHNLDVRVTTEHYERLVKSLLTNTTITIDEFRKKAKDDWYFTPKTCLKRRIIDDVY